MTRAVRVGALAVLVGAVYLVVAVVLGLPAVVAALAVAVGFGWLDSAASAVASALVGRDGPDPLSVLGRFVGSDAEEPTHMARVVCDATGAAEVVVRLRVGDGLDVVGRAFAVAGPTAGPLGDPRASEIFAVWDGGRLLGAIEVDPGDEPLTPTESALVADLAGQARLLLRNESLTTELRARAVELEERAAELRASRRRVVAAHDAERFALERAVHDGAQQRLVGLAMRIGLARSVAEREPARAATEMESARAMVTDARATVDVLARGLYPAALVERGVVAALREETASTAGVSVSGDLGASARPSAEVEAALYFTCLEAVHNAVRHGAATRVDVSVAADGDGIAFVVSDDGGGFDASAVVDGSGLSGMADRMAALGGSVVVTSDRGRGTRVSGRVPR